ncbi:MAG: tetratricopeptide repeat protein [Burkholderiales bacterium]|nr:tetratricopeptide repeat protein [Burkholderiales bacterium]
MQFKKVIEIDPDNANAYLNWGYALDRLNRHEEAKIQYKNAIKYVPDLMINISYFRNSMSFSKSDESKKTNIKFQKGKIPEFNLN